MGNRGDFSVKSQQNIQSEEYQPLVSSSVNYGLILGGEREDYALGVDTDAQDNVYVAGRTFSDDFPPGGLNRTWINSFDCFVSKVSSSGELLWTTLVGGLLNDEAIGISVDDQGNAFVVGTTYSSDFPVIDPFQEIRRAASEGFIFKLSPSGELIFSSYIGGIADDQCTNVALDSQGNPVIIGWTTSPDFYSIEGLNRTFMGGFDTFVLSMTPDGSEIRFSSIIGGSLDERPRGIAIDSEDGIHIAGTTDSPDFPAVNGFDDSHNGGADCFLLSISADGKSLMHSSYFGGNGRDVGYGIAMDDQDLLYICGLSSSVDFPQFGPIEYHLRGHYDAFIFKTNVEHTGVAYSALLGGSDLDSAWDIAITSDGSIALTGHTYSEDFEVLGDSETYSGGSDCFVLVLDEISRSAKYSQLFGGNQSDGGTDLVIDSMGDIIVVGGCSSPSFPAINSNYTEYSGDLDCFVLKLSISTVNQFLTIEIIILVPIFVLVLVTALLIKRYFTSKTH